MHGGQLVWTARPKLNDEMWLWTWVETWETWDCLKDMVDPMPTQRQPKQIVRWGIYAEKAFKKCGHIVTGVIWQQSMNTLLDKSGQGSCQAGEGGLSCLVGQGVSSSSRQILEGQKSCIFCGHWSKKTVFNQRSSSSGLGMPQDPPWGDGKSYWREKHLEHTLPTWSRVSITEDRG